MANTNLLVSFQLGGDSRIHVKAAARIKIGQGRLTVYDAQSGKAESFYLPNMQSLNIQRPSTRGQKVAERSSSAATPPAVSFYMPLAARPLPV